MLVGEEEKRFVLHKAIVTTKSAFFRAACSGRFKESTDKIVRLPESDVASLEVYLQWIYTGNIVVVNAEEVTEEEAKDGSSRYLALAELYVLADHLDDIHLRNAVIDAIVDLRMAIGRCPPPKVPAVAYKETPEGSNLRKLLTDYYTSCNDVKWFKENGSTLPQGLMVDIVVRHKQPPLPIHDRLRKCDYHEHNDEVPKCV